MGTFRKLSVYVAVVAGVLAAAIGVGAVAAPVGLSNVAPVSDHGGAMTGAMVRGLAAAEDGYRLEVATDTVVAGHRTTYRFRILGDDGVVTDFDIEHTKPMHMIVVRRDFAGFQHLHPWMAPDGTWSIPMSVDQPGAYRVFTDFATDGKRLTLATDLFVPGDFRPVPVPPVAEVGDTGDGYTVELSGHPTAGEDSTLTFVVRRDGQEVTDLQDYLGALGHLVALRDGDLAYLHVHPDEDALSFDAEFPTPGTYRLFLQFRHDDQVRTAAFTVEVEEESR